MVAVLVAVLLIGTFFNLGLLISALTKQAVPALVTLLLAWVFLYGVYPRLAAAAAQVIYPVKSEARVALEKNQIRRNIEKERDGETNLVAKIMPKDEKSEAYKEGQQKQLDIYNKYQSQLEKSWQILERDTEERRKTGIALTADIARLSPVSCFIRPLAELGRTGWLEYQQFSTQVRQYLDVLNRDIFNKQLETRMKGGSNVVIMADESAAAPVFKYVRTPAEVVIQNVLPDIVMLILFNLVFFAGAFIAFIRYDPR
jgi:ABC-type transport system involved in multi-copper enzyme maturation permease subunit